MSDRTLAPTLVGNEKGLMDMLKSRQGTLKQVLPASTTLTVERIMKVVAAAASRTPQLLRCTQESVWLSIQRSVELGLEPGSALGHAHLVPYRNNQTNTYECTLQIGYQGLRHLVQRSGKVRNVVAEVVHERDTFELVLGTERKLVHRYDLGSERGEPIGAYSVAFFVDGTIDFEVMGREDIEKRMRVSKMGFDRETRGAKGVWREWQSEMWEKTVLRRHCARLPMSLEDQDHLVLAESDADVGEFAALTASPAIVASLPDPADAIVATVRGRKDAETIGTEVTPEDTLDDVGETSIVVADEELWRSYCERFGFDVAAGFAALPAEIQESFLADDSKATDAGLQVRYA